MSHEDPYRPNQGRDRGAYTPPTDDDLPFNRQGYDPRRGGGGGGGGGKAPPMTLIISAVVLLVLIIAVVVYYRAGPRSSNDAPPAVGTPVGPMKAEAPIDAQPVDPTAGIDVYAAEETTPAAPTFIPPPEAVRPRPAPAPTEAAPAPAPARPTPTTPPPAKAEPTPAPTGGTSGVQIGAFSTPNLAEREYNAVVGRYPALTEGASRRVQEVTASNGSTVYRTTVTGLSRERATGLCNAIKAAGGDCIVR
ncbi:SPOR domain-containing protein [Brevundimonas sp.]|uniref:SPOR domain-containing protein n=1 Tax=Brevundimonas sp. TaxID=1871086 RepID=UPI002D4C75CE|nr:SPOR domain-containing protein [Brevundimonas sp.]HYC69217.1 SPOR domain-containing protein [Brevundimonas sp.]